MLTVNVRTSTSNPAAGSNRKTSETRMPVLDTVDVSACNPNCPFLNPGLLLIGATCTHYQASNATAIPATGVPTWCPLLVHNTIVRYVAPPP